MFFKQKISNKMYLKILVMIVATIEIAILLVSSILIFNMRKNMLNQLYGIYVDNINKSIMDTRGTIDSIKSTSIQIKFDYYVQMLSSYKKPDPTQFIPALEQLNNYRRAMSIISSIYIYNSGTFYLSSNESELAPNAIESKDELQDKEAIKIIDNYKSYGVMTPIPRKITNLKTGEQYNGFSFLLYDKVQLGPKTIIMINLKSNDWLENTIKQETQLSNTKSIIVDNKGNLIAGDNDNKFLTEINEAYVKKINARKYSSGYIIENVNGEKSLITYAKMPSLKWNYISIIPYKAASKGITSAIENVLVICTLIFLFGIVAAVYLSRKLYNPVENLLNKLSIFETQQTDILNENKQKFLINFIRHSSQLEELFIQKGFNEYNINLSLTNPYTLVFMQIDKWEQLSNNVKDRDLIKYAITSVTKEMLQPQFKAEIVDIFEDKMLLIVNTENNYGDDNKEVFEKIRSIQSMINNYYNVSISIAVSNEVTVYKDIQKTFEKLMDGSKNRFFYGYGAIVLYEDIIKRSKVKYSYHEREGKEIITALTTGKQEKAKEIYLGIIKEIENCNYTSFQMYLTLLFWEVSKGIKATQSSINKNWADSIEAFITEMPSIETIDIFNGVVIKLFDSISESFTVVGSSKFENIANKVTEIIDRRFSDINLSVEAVADEIGFTAPYITKIFKQHTGKTVIEYIMEKRIEKAKELLATTNDSVASISEKCGFANITYFYRAFKKAVGTTPSLYRTTTDNK